MNRVINVALAILLSSQVALAQDDTDSAASADRNPVAVIDTLHGGLLNIMQRAVELGFSGRAEIIGPIVEDSFDIEVLSASAIGISIWRTWSDEQKETYERTFSRFLTANYAYQFDGFSGQSFRVLSTKSGPKKTTLVESHLVRPGKDPVRLTYLTRTSKGKVGIIDVYSDGTVSEAARRRSEFATIYRDSGFDGLISSIESQISDLESGTPAPESG